MFLLNMDENKSNSFTNLSEYGTIILGLSIGLYTLGILFFLDRALLMLSNV